MSKESSKTRSFVGLLNVSILERRLDIVIIRKDWSLTVDSVINNTTISRYNYARLSKRLVGFH